MSDQRDFSLGDWTVRRQRSIIERDIEAVHIKPKSIAVLECLASADGDVVSRDELFESVWPGSVVSDDVLTQCIVELRKAFGETAQDAKYIETIPKKGFRLVPKVRPLDDSPTDTNLHGKAGIQPAWKRTTVILPILGAAIVVTLAFVYQLLTSTERNRTLTIEDTQTLAVLPFTDLSPGQDQEYFADGLSEELLNRLGRLADLRVTGRTSSFYFKGKDVDIEQISAALNVGHVLEGSVSKSGNQLRITANLVDTSNGFQLWSETYDRQLADVFVIEDEISEAVARALSITLGVGELGRIKGGTTSVEAYDEFFRGLSQYRINSPESVRRAIDHFKRAVEIDPSFANAWGFLAQIFSTAWLVTGGDLARNWVALSGEAIARANSLAPDSPLVIETSAMRLTWLGRWRDVALTLARSPDISRSYSNSTYLIFIGRGQDAIPALERERRLDPFSLVVPTYLAQVYTESGLFIRALEELERGYGLGIGRTIKADFGAGVALSLGDKDLISKWLRRQGEQRPFVRETNETLAGIIDNREASLRLLHDLYNAAGVDYNWLTMWAAFHGDDELALSAAMRQPVFNWILWTPIAAGVRKLPGFKDFVRKWGMEEYWREFGWGYYCQPVSEDEFECF